MKLLSVTLLFLSLLFVQAASAEETKIIGTIKKTIQTPPSSSIRVKRDLQKPTNHSKNIKFLHIQLSKKAAGNLKYSLREALTSQEFFFKKVKKSSLPDKVDLGMNNVPILDQGEHGTCVTFAITAAVNALLRKGDYSSQLCQLMLGNYLKKVGYTQSGWDGTYASAVINQMNLFGIVSKEKQRLYSCGNLRQYPTSGIEPHSSMNIEDFHQLSESFAKYEIFWTPIFTSEEAFVTHVSPDRLLKKVKIALAAGDRLSFGILLLDLDSGVAGAVGKYKTAMDSWVLTPEIAYKNSELDAGGHEMVIIGYDDNAIAMDDNGQKHQGLFKLRNSWGDDVGDRGDFYMSYDYFKSLVIEIYRISKGNPYKTVSKGDPYKTE